MSLVLDVYCKSRAHLSESFRDAVCKKWDQEHPDLAPSRDGDQGGNDRPAPPQEPAAPPRQAPSAPAPRVAPPAPKVNPQPSAALPPASTGNSTNPFLMPSNSTTPLPPDVGGASAADPFPTTTVAEGQTAGNTIAPSGSSATVMIVSSVIAGLFAVLLVGAFVMYRLKKRRASHDDDVQGKRSSNTLENGIFDAVPRANPKAEFTIEDFAAAPSAMYEGDTNHVEKKPQIPQITTSFEDVSSPAPPLTPWGSKSGAEVNSLIFASPYEAADTEYHISEDHVFGAPMYIVPRVGVAGINLTTPNAAAVAQNTMERRASPPNPRHSMEWPAEFDDDPLNPEFGFEIPYGANMAAVDGIEEFPDVPTTFK